jgi:hypothetical protein
MLTDLGFTLAYIIYFKGVFIEPFAANVPENWIPGISPEGAGVIGMALNFIVASIVARNTAPPPPHIQQMVDDIRMPNQYCLNLIKTDMIATEAHGKTRQHKCLKILFSVCFRGY